MFPFIVKRQPTLDRTVAQRSWMSSAKFVRLPLYTSNILASDDKKKFLVVADALKVRQKRVVGRAGPMSA